MGFAELANVVAGGEVARRKGAQQAVEQQRASKFQDLALEQKQREDAINARMKEAQIAEAQARAQSLLHPAAKMDTPESFSTETTVDPVTGKPVLTQIGQRGGKARTVVDPVTGRPLQPYQKPPEPREPRKDSTGLPPVQANQVKVQQTALLNLQRSLGALKQHVAANGVAYLPGTQERAMLEPLVRDAMIQFKEAANLGAITGPDMELIEGMIGNPASMTQILKGRKEGALASFAQVEQSLKRRAKTMEDVYGVKMPDAFYQGGGMGEPVAVKTITVNGKTFQLPE